MKKIFITTAFITVLLLWAHRKNYSDIVLNDRLERELEEAKYYGC